MNIYFYGVLIQKIKPVSRNVFINFYNVYQRESENTQQELIQNSYLSFARHVAMQWHR